MEQFNHYLSDAMSNWPGNMRYLNLLGWSEELGHVHVRVAATMSRINLNRSIGL